MVLPNSFQRLAVVVPVPGSHKAKLMQMAHKQPDLPNFTLHATVRQFFRYASDASDALFVSPS